MRIPIIYGVLSGIVLSLWILTGYYLKWYITGFSSYWLLLAYLIQIVILFIGIKAYKDKKYSGEITYLNAFVGGLVITFFLTIIYSASTYLYFINSGNELLEFALSEGTKALQELKKPVSDINATRKMIQEALTPANQLKSAFIEKSIIGLFFSLVFATILRKRITDQIPVK